MSAAGPGLQGRDHPSKAVGVATGLVAAGVAIGVAQLVAGMVNPQASPIVAVGQAAIDATPEWLKSFAIRTFGERDKYVLLAGIVLGLAAAAIGLGIASVRRPSVAFAALGAFGAIGVAGALTRPAARAADVLPSLAGVGAGATALLALASLWLPRRSWPRPEGRAAEGRAFDRRRFLLTGAAGVAIAFVAGGAGNALARRFRADASRAAVRIPGPASPAGPSTGAELPVPGLGPFFTPNERFYRVDTALLVPALMAEDWRLRVHGMVEREITLDYERLLSRPLIERDITLTCVSNPVGGRYAGNARWIGARCGSCCSRPVRIRAPTRSSPGRWTDSRSARRRRSRWTGATPFSRSR